jgi:hypothetical protein
MNEVEFEKAIKDPRFFCFVGRLPADKNGRVLMRIRKPKQIMKDQP